VDARLQCFSPLSLLRALSAGSTFIRGGRSSRRHHREAISSFVFKQTTTPREALGIVLIVIGVAALVWTH